MDDDKSSVPFIKMNRLSGHSLFNTYVANIREELERAVANVDVIEGLPSRRVHEIDLFAYFKIPACVFHEPGTWRKMHTPGCRPFAVKPVLREERGSTHI